MFQGEKQEEGIALALSGGGFRAMLFHLGSLWRLNEMGILSQISRVSSVSGGAILAGCLAVRWTRLSFQSGIATNFDDEIVQPILDFSSRHVDVWAVGLGLIPFVNAPKVAASFYRRHLVGDATLQDLPDEPRVIFNATHLPSGTNWRFSKPYMGSYRLGLVSDPEIDVGTAIAASSAFPPVLSPLTLTLDPDSFEKTEGADLYGYTELRKKVELSDGGVYDNLALQAVQRRYKTILVSDAGGPLAVGPTSVSLWTKQFMRTLNIATEQTRALRRLALVTEYKAGRIRGALWRIATDVRDFPIETPFEVHPEWLRYLSAIRTRLNPFSEQEKAYLVNWGYLLSDAALRSYVWQDVKPPTELPFGPTTYNDLESSVTPTNGSVMGIPFFCAIRSSSRAESRERRRACRMLLSVTRPSSNMLAMSSV